VLTFNKADGTVLTIAAFYLDGTAYLGDISLLVQCTDITAVSTEYLICDNGVQKIVRVCWQGCTPTGVSYFFLDRTVAPVPADFADVLFGACPIDGGMEVNLLRVNGTAAASGEGPSGAGVLRVTIANDSTGQITANAGTDLNTSLLAVETGGNLATVATNTNNLSLAQAAVTAGQKGNLIFGAATTAAPTYVTAQSYPLSLNLSGGLRVDGSGVTQPISGSVTVTGNPAINIAQIAGTATAVNNGSATAGVIRVTVADDSTGQLKLAAGTAEIGNVKNSGTFAVQAAQSGTWNITNISGTISLPTGAATSALQTQPGVDIGDVTVNNAAGAAAVNIQDGGNSITVDGTVSITANSSVNLNQIGGTAVSTSNGATNAGTLRVTLSNDSSGQVSLAAGAQIIGSLAANQSVNNAQISGTAMSVNNGNSDAGTQRVTLSADGTGQVRLAAGSATIGALTANQSVNLAQVAGGTAITSGVTGSQAVGGDTASATADAGNPVKIGFQGRTTLPTSVADAQRVNGIADKVGRQINVLGINRELRKSQATTITSSTAATTIITAGAAGVFNDLVSLHISNSSSTGTTITIQDKNGGGGLNIWTLWIPGGFNGFIVNLPGESIPQTSAGFHWDAACGTSVASIYIIAVFEQNK